MTSFNTQFGPHKETRPTMGSWQFEQRTAGGIWQAVDPQNLLIHAGADIGVNGQKIINMADPTSAQDAATKAYVDAAILTGPASGPVHLKGTATTTDGTTVVPFAFASGPAGATLPYPIPSNSVVTVSAWISAIKTNATAYSTASGFLVYFQVRNQGGTLTIEPDNSGILITGVTPNQLATQMSIWPGTADVTAYTSTTNLGLQCVGIAATTLRWVAWISLHVNS